MTNEIKEGILKDLNNMFNFLSTVPVTGQVNCFNMGNSLFTLQGISKIISEEKSEDENTGGDDSK